MNNSTTRYLRLTAALALCAAMIQSPAFCQDDPGANAPDRPPYTINPGDILLVSVWKELDLQQEVIVRPDGAFSFPLTGDIQAEGKSVERVRQALVERLSKYIPDPVVTVSARDLGGNKVYVLGQVNRPGEYRAAGQMDVMQALAMGGGMTAFAQVGDIKVLRRINGKLVAIRFNYKDIEKGKRLEQNILLQPGDVVVVP